jgi:enoyl-CoA hydratase/carnithine racemase
LYTPVISSLTKRVKEIAFSVALGAAASSRTDRPEYSSPAFIARAGGGAAIAAACDLRLATPDAQYGFPIARTLGNCLSMSNISRLTALLGPARTKDIIFTARLVEAPEALALGLLNEVVPDVETLQRRADETAHLLASHAPLTLEVTKEAVRRIRKTLSRDEGEDLILKAYMSADFREGMDAFLTKRKPVWKGE